jgi:hydrogenase maturation protease
MMTHATVFVCGDRHRRDDAAALRAADLLGQVVPEDVELRRVGQLGPDDLVAASSAGRCLVIDAVRGITPGTVIAMPLVELESGGPTSASSHALPLPTVIALADALGGDMSRGTFLGIGGEEFELGEGLTPRVEEALDAFVAAIARTLFNQGGAACA